MPGWLIDESGFHTATSESYNGGTAPTPNEATKKFGSSSGRFIRTNNSVGGGVEIPDSNDLLPSTDVSFTLQWWMYPQWSSFNSGIFGQKSAVSNNGHHCRLRNDNRQITIDLQTTGGTFNMNAGDPGGYAWHHVAIVRNTEQNYWQVFRDGQRANTWSFGTFPRGNPLVNVASPFVIGISDRTADPLGQNINPWHGYIDAFHLEVGVARWDTTNFDAGALPQPSVTAYTKLLMNFNETFYQIQGTLSHDARITITDEDSRTIEYDDNVSAGSYSIPVDDDTVKTVIASRTSNGKTLGYGRVLPVAV